MPAPHVHPISPTCAASMCATGVWSEKCPLSLERLREVHASYVTFDGKVEHGVMVVMDAVASHVATILDILFKKNFPIAKMLPIDTYGGSDDRSMDDNNSSAFNYRPIAHTNQLSLHSYGVAIDINPVQNPYVGNPSRHGEKRCGILEVWPEAGVSYVNRVPHRPGMLEMILDVFFENGFREWGGHWILPIDYHHVQLPRPLAELLALMSADDAQDFFNWYVKNPHHVFLWERISDSYGRDPKACMANYRL